MRTYHDEVGDRIIAGLLKYANRFKQDSFEQVYIIFCKRSATDWRNMLLQVEGCESTAALFIDPRKTTAQSFFAHTAKQADKQFNLRDSHNKQENFFETYSEYNH